MRELSPDKDLPTLTAYVAWWARNDPEREAAVLGADRWTYRKLDEAVSRYARAFLARGIAKGDRVATLAPPGLDFLVTYLAATRVGAIWVGLNPKYRLGELEHVISDAAPKLILTRAHPELVALKSMGPDLVDLEDERSTQDFLRIGEAISNVSLGDAHRAVTAADASVLVYTSGSTGKPKGAILSHEGIVRFALGQNRLWPLSPLRVLNYFPINHVGCLNDILAPALVGGGLSVFMEQFDPAASLELMQQERITFWASVPSVFQMQLALENFDTFDLSHVQLIVWEGAAMAPEMIRSLGDICLLRATNYGMTETTSAITALEPSDDLDLLENTVGGAFPGVEIRLVGSDGAIVASGETGEVQARSSLNCLGYWNNPLATEKAFSNGGWFRTGDLAVQRPDGRFRIVGRLKEMFKSGGYNVYPPEVEQVVESHPGVVAAAVIGVPDAEWDEVGVAFYQGSATSEELGAWCRDRLANYKIPKRFIREAELPLLPIGKIDKPALREKALAEKEQAA